MKTEKDYSDVRGYMIKLYPTEEQVIALRELQHSQRLVWNWMIRQSDDANEARKAYAVKQGLIPPKPVRPESYDGLDPEEAKARKEQWRQEMSDWYKALDTATKKDPACAYRNFKDVLAHFGDKFDYQLFNRYLRSIDAKPLPAAVGQALAKSLFQKAARPKRRRKTAAEMPVRTRSGNCIQFGTFGKRGKNENFYDVQVSFPGGSKIRGRGIGKHPDGPLLEGVSITEKVDGWWASGKYHAPARVLPEYTPGSVIGIDAGLYNIAAMSDGGVVQNPRGKEYAERIAGRQALASMIEDAEVRAIYERKTKRIELRATRQVKHMLYNEVIKAVGVHEIIAVEKLPKHIGQMGSDMRSSMRTMIGMLQLRYGDRVREVDPAYTSQECSQCGHRAKDAWSYEHGRYGKCPECGHTEDRDVNAARNIARKYAESLTG